MSDPSGSPPGDAGPSKPALPGKRSRLRGWIRWLRVLVLVPVALSALGIAALGYHFLRLDEPYPLEGLVLLARGEEQPADAGGIVERDLDYLYGDRLGSEHQRRSGNALGSARRQLADGLLRLELSDGQGRPLVRVEPEGHETGKEHARRLRVAELGVGDAGELLLTSEVRDGTRSTDLERQGGGGPGRMVRLEELEAFRGWLGRGARTGTRLLSGESPRSLELLLSTTDEGWVWRTAHEGSVSFIGGPGPDRDEAPTELPGYRFTIGVERDRWSLETSSVAWVVRDDRGALAAVRLVRFRFRHRGQRLVEYLADLDGSGVLDPDAELISRVHVAGHRGGAIGIHFLAGNAALDDLQALELADTIEGYLADACASVTVLREVEEARDDALALLATRGIDRASILGPIDLARPAASWARLPAAAGRDYASRMETDLGPRAQGFPLSVPEGRTFELASAASPAGGREEVAAVESPTPAPEATVAPTPTINVLAPERVALVKHAQQLLRRLGPDVFPGFGADQPPLVLVDEGREWWVGHPRPPADCAATPTEGMEATICVRVAELAESADGAARIGGVWSVVLGRPESLMVGDARWALRYAHLAFHVFQHDRDPERVALVGDGSVKGDWQAARPFPGGTGVERGLALLAVALERGAAILDGERRGDSGGSDLDEVVRATVGAHEALGALLDAESIETLRFLSWWEGVARYVEQRLARRAAAQGLRPPGASTGAPYADASGAITAEERARLRELASGQVGPTGLYAAGAQLARLLDARFPAWQRRYFDEATTLDGLLAEYTGRIQRPRPTPWVVPSAEASTAAPGAEPQATAPEASTTPAEAVAPSPSLTPGETAGEASPAVTPAPTMTASPPPPVEATPPPTPSP